MKILSISPYFTKNNGISDFVEYFNAELTRRKHLVVNLRIFYREQPWRNLDWLKFGMLKCEVGDVVVIHHTPTVSGPLLPAFLGICRVRKIKVIIICHEPLSSYNEHLSRLTRPLLRGLERLICSLANLVVVHTSDHFNELTKLEGTAPIHRQDFPVYGPKQLTSSRTGSELGFFGMISPKKGLELLIDAYQERVPGSFPKLWILGSPAVGCEVYYTKLESRVRPDFKSLIEFTGYVGADELDAMFNRLSILILPYLKVSQSAALAYACNHRIPFLASDLKYFKDFNARFKVGRTFETGSKESLLTELDRLITNPIAVPTNRFDRLMEELSVERYVDSLLVEFER